MLRNRQSLSETLKQNKELRLKRQSEKKNSPIIETMIIDSEKVEKDDNSGY
jgi:hypothetical protein